MTCQHEHDTVVSARVGQMPLFTQRMCKACAKTLVARMKRPDHVTRDATITIC